MNKSDIVFLKVCTFLILEWEDWNQDETATILSLASKPCDKIKINDKPRLIEEIKKLSRIIIRALKLEWYFEDLDKWAFFKVG